MILECPECGKRYLVDPRAVGMAGRTVRCAACKHEWHAELSDDARSALDEASQSDHASDAANHQDEYDAAEMAGMAENGQEAAPRRTRSSANVPAVARKPSPTPLGLRLATLALAVLFAGVSVVYFRPMIVAAVPALEKAYQVIGLYNSDGIMLAEIAYERSEIGTKDSHQFSGYLVNTSKEARRLPALKFQLLGAEGQVIKNRTLREKSTLAAGEKKAFRTAIDTSPGSTALVIVEHGNSLEIKTRSRPKPNDPSNQKEASHDE